MDEKQPLLKNENQVDVENAGKKTPLSLSLRPFRSILSARSCQLLHMLRIFTTRQTEQSQIISRLV